MRILLVLFVMLAGGGALYFYYLSPEAVRKRAVQHLVAEMNYAAGSNSRYKVGTFLDRFLLPNATLELEVGMQTTPPFPPQPMMQQKFTKEMLAQFIDNVLYPLQHFSGEAILKEYIPGKTLDTARFRVRIVNQAEGNSYMRRNLVYTSFAGDTTCMMAVTFVDEAGYMSPKLQEGRCQSTISVAPKNGYSKTDDIKQKIKESLQKM